MPKLGLRLTVSAPTRLVSKMGKVKGVKFTTESMEIPTRQTRGFTDDKSTLFWFTKYMNESRGDFLDGVERDLNNIGSSLISSLKDNFRTNLAAVSPVSSSRVLRRKAFKELNHASSQIGPNDPSPYTNSIFNQAISSFNYNVFRGRGKSITMRVGGDVVRGSHPDFTGYKSGYDSPNQIAMSVYGLKVSNPKGTSSTGKKMIIPVESRSDAFAVIKDGQFFSLRKKGQEGMLGVPVIFKESIRATARTFHDPKVGNRIVFWGKDRSGNVTYYKHNVYNTLVNHGIIDKDMRGRFRIV